MTTIVFEPHATTPDNERKIASGHYDVALSEAGISQAKALGKRRCNEHFDVVFCSDLTRAYETAKLAFGNKFPIIQDERLRECNYGNFEHKPNIEVEAERPHRIDQPFPNGESYEQRSQAMKRFLQELFHHYSGKRALIIGHRATQYGLERWVAGKPLEEIVSAPWHWQPGWTYTLTRLP